MIGFLGISGAIGFCLISSIALVPALAVGGLVYWFGGNSILQKNICEKPPKFFPVSSGPGREYFSWESKFRRISCREK